MAKTAKQWIIASNRPGLVHDAQAQQIRLLHLAFAVIGVVTMHLLLASRMVGVLQGNLEDLLRDGRPLFRGGKVLMVHKRFKTIAQRPTPDGNVTIRLVSGTD